MIREIQHNEFTDEVVDISEPIVCWVKEFEDYPGVFNREFFMSEWQSLMKLGIARTWVSKDAVIGVTFCKQLFTGDLAATVVFWHAKGTRNPRETVKLLKTVEQEAKRAGCNVLYSAAYRTLDGDRVGRLYEAMKFQKSETIFRKGLK